MIGEVIGEVIADISLNGFGAFIVVAVTVITIGLGAVGIGMQRRSSAIIDAMKEERELELRERQREREADKLLQAEQSNKIASLESENTHLNSRLNDLNELVTQAAKVELLRTEVQDAVAGVQSGITELLRRVPAPAV